MQILRRSASIDVDLSEIHLTCYDKIIKSRQHSFSAINRATTETIRFPSALEAFMSGGCILAANAVLSEGWGVMSETKNPELLYRKFEGVDELSRDILADSPDSYSSVLRVTDAECIMYGRNMDMLFLTDEDRRYPERLNHDKRCSCCIVLGS